MEEALGRKLSKEDIKSQLHRYYGLPVRKVKEIMDSMKSYVFNSPEFKDWRLQREHAYINGAMKILRMLQTSDSTKNEKL
ncbi:MAG: hypothetical protein NC453_21710 [Muribaculum sp.]|nr:hypothetical protein [Muribaculum sp.]